MRVSGGCSLACEYFKKFSIASAAITAPLTVSQIKTSWQSLMPVKCLMAVVLAVFGKFYGSKYNFIFSPLFICKKTFCFHLSLAINFEKS